MQKYEGFVEVERVVHERYRIEVTAENIEEASDLIYEVFIDYTNSELVLDRMLRDRQATKQVEIINIEFEQTPVEKVFGENDDGEGDGPKLA